MRQPSPIARGAATVLCLIATFIITDPALLAMCWLVALLPLVIAGDLVRAHALFLGSMLPLIGAMVAVWGWLIGAPPGFEMGSDPLGGTLFAARTSFRLLVAGTIIQLSFLTINPAELWPTLRSWGLRGELLAIVVASIALIAGISRIADQVIIALKAKGIIRSSSKLSHLKALPTILSNIWRQTTHTSITRVDVKWDPQQTLQTIELAPSSVSSSLLTSVILISASAAWLSVGILTRLQ